MFRRLFKYLQGAAHIWDTHEIGLAKEERELLVIQFLFDLRDRFVVKYVIF